MKLIRHVTHVSLLRSAVCASLLMSQVAFANSLPPGCEMRERATIPLSFTEDLRPIGEATINGTTVSAMLSTGAADSLIFNKKVLDRLGVPVHHTVTKLDPEDWRNPTKNDLLVEVSHANIKGFSIGSIKGKGGFYRVEDFMDDTYGLRVGAGTLFQHDLEIALDAGYLKTYEPRGCGTAHMAYWDPQASSVLAAWDPWKHETRVVFTATVGGKPITA